LPQKLFLSPIFSKKLKKAAFSDSLFFPPPPDFQSKGAMSMSEQVKIVITTGQPQARITGKGSVSKLEKPKPGGSGWQQKQTKPWKPTRKPTFARDGHFDPTGIPSPPTNIPGPFSGKFAPPPI
jgi:hypothetical protein